MDEDVFLLSECKLMRLQQFMQQAGYHYCGMRDGGVVPIRSFNPSVCNPFFNIFDTNAISKKFPDFSEIEYRVPTVASHLEPESFNAPMKYCMYEPYYKEFLWLRCEFRCLFLDASTHQDGISTVLYDHVGDPLLVHCWYARRYRRSPKRFREAYRFALDWVSKKMELDSED